MYSIIVKGEAKVMCHTEDGKWEEYERLYLLDGIECPDDFVEYFDGDFREELLDGYMHFEYKNKKLYTITTYNSTKELNDEQLKSLEEYTVGQWSDGIGEGFEQFPINMVGQRLDDGVYISPWFDGQVTTIEQRAQE